MTRHLFVLSTACAALTLAACGPKVTTSFTMETDIVGAAGDIIGQVTLTDLGKKGTEVFVEVAGISEGSHAMHFHEVGLCENPDFKSSGGHYNPTGADHGKMMANGPHAGDMMNVEVGADEKGEFTVINSRVSIRGNHGLPAILDDDGTALVLHAVADDYKSQPSGAAGARIGCAEFK